VTAASAVDSSLQAVIFDLDGTLVDSLPGIQYSAGEAVRAVRPDFELPDLRSHIGPPLREMFQHLIFDLTNDELEALIAIFRRSYDSTGWTMTSLFSGVAHLLDDLCGLGIGLFVASNKASLAAGRILQALGLGSRFSAVFCRDSRTPAYASKSEAVGCLLRERELNPALVWLVGDGCDDYEAARSNGLRFIRADYGYGSSRCRDLAPSEACIASPGELMALIPFRCGLEN
jgi:phosphoglycolate phosphatase